MIFPSRQIVQELREMHPEGTRVALIQMDDPYSKLIPGDQGTVTGVDDAGSVMISWDRGSSLSAVYGVDRIRKI